MELNLRQLTIIMNKIAEDATITESDHGSTGVGFSNAMVCNRAISRFKFFLRGDIDASICLTMRGGNWDCAAPPYEVIHTNWLTIIIRHPKFRLRYKVDMPVFDREKLNGPFTMKLRDHYATAACYCEGKVVNYRLTPLASIEEVEEEIVKLLL